MIEDYLKEDHNNMKNHKKKTISNDSVMRLVTIMVFGVVIAFYLITGVFSYIIAKKEADYLGKRTESAFNIEHKHNVDVVREYSYWNESYNNLVKNRNSEWIEININRYIFNSYDYNWIAIESDGDISLVAKTLTSDIKEQDLKNITIKTNEYAKDNGLGIYYQTKNNKIYKITAVPFVNDESKFVYKEHLLFATEINQDYLNKIVHKYELPELYFTKNYNRDSDLVLKSHKEIYGYISFVYDSPMKKIIPYMIFVGILLLCVFIKVVRIILLKELKENAKYEKMLYEAATVDYLTNVYNRRFFLEESNKMYNKLNKEKRSSSLLILDIDHFKNINDTYGHAMGDKALMHFADICRTNIREYDLIGRIGGEEFAIFLPDTNKEDSISIANRIHDELKLMPINNGYSNIYLTVSVGGETNYEFDYTFEELSNNADKSLYISKNNGRNRTSFLN